MEEKLLARARRIRLAVFDVDGVLTDGGLLLGPGGAEFKTFHVHDGLGLVMLKEAGMAVAVISSRSSEVVAERMAALGIEYVYQGRHDKRGTLSGLMEQLKVTPEETAYVGDDLVDLGAMDLAGLSVAVADAHEVVRRRAHWVTHRVGGRGAVREVCEMLLEARGQLEAALKRYLPA
jgi:3-deoxy-D-manno-octulosonate 8-phosphate phosphatase (KDO 8-P phosphatase)